jgi:hypothetical protein
MTPPDRIWWREAVDGGGYATVHDPTPIPGGTTIVYAPERQRPEGVDWGARAEALEDEVERLRGQLEAVERRRGQAIEGLQDELEHREAALGRALGLLGSAYDHDAPGVRSRIHDRIGLPPGAIRSFKWPDVLRWIADEPEEGGGDGQDDAEPPEPPPDPEPPARVERPGRDSRWRWADGIPVCAACGAATGVACRRTAGACPFPGESPRMGSRPVRPGERVGTDPANVDRTGGNGWTH